VPVEGSRRGAADDRTVRLVVPADAEYGRVARTAAAGLALRLGFTYRAIEDLRLAIDETLILLLQPDGAAETVRFEFRPIDDGLTVDASLAPGGGPTDPKAQRRFERLVKPIVDEYALDDRTHVHLVKHRR
jgi:hypothetical protein